MVYTNQHTIAILAYNNHEITINNIEMLINDGNKNILLFDNGLSLHLKILLNKRN